MWLSMSYFSTILSLVVILLLSYIWLKYKCSYWQRHNVPYVHPLPLLGNLKDLLLLRISFGDLFKELHAEAALKDAPVIGIYVLHSPALIIRDPELIKSVLIKNFNMFLNRYEAADPIHDSMGSLTLPLSKYPIWRESRKRMAEFFTSGRLKKRIYPLMLETAAELENYIERRVEQSATSTCIIEVKEMCALFTTDLTSLLSFGIKAESLKNGDSVMRKATRDLLKPDLVKALHFFAVFFLPHLTGVIRANVFSRRYSNLMRREMEKVIKSRYKDCTNQRGDLVDLLLKFKGDSLLNGKHQFAYHPDFIASQAAIFLLAGFETSSSLIAFALYELTKQPEIQMRLRAELKVGLELLNSGHLSYESLTNMTYLHMVVSEALRMYPAAAFINRECTPNDNEFGCSLRPFVDYVMPRGMPAYISILGLQRDAKFWPEPDRFDPQRFAPERISSIHPMTYIPFGSGPHGCIGNRLGLMQVKLGLVHILKNYKVEKCARTVEQIKFDPKSFMLHAESGIYLRFVKDHLI